MKKRKVFLTTFLGLLFTLVLSYTALAEVDSYVVADKKNNIVYNYNTNKLIDDFLNNKVGIKAPLWDDFNEKYSTNNFYAFHHNSGKFVPYGNIKEAFMNSALQNKIFDLEAYMKAKDTPVSKDIPGEFAKLLGDKAKIIGVFKDNIILEGKSDKPLVIDSDLYITGDNVSIKNIVVKGTIILSPGAKGKAVLENVSAEKIEVLSGAEDGIRFNKVTAKILKVKEDLKNPVIGLETSKIDETNYKRVDNSNGGDSGNVNPGNPDDTMKAVVSKVDKNDKEYQITVNITNIKANYITIVVHKKGTEKIAYIDQTKSGEIVNNKYSFSTVLDKGSSYEATIKTDEGKTIKVSF